MFVFTPVILFFITFSYANTLEYFAKCCENGFILNNFMKCEISPNNDNLTTIMDISYGIIDMNFTCSTHNKRIISNTEPKVQVYIDILCADVDPNGTLIIQNCSFIHKSNNEKMSEHCKSLFTPIKFWGASIVVFASFIYIFPYSIVVILYCIMPDLRRKAFDKGVVCFCLSQVGTAATLGTFGYFNLCHNQIIPIIIYSIVGLILMFLTISSVLWMFIMCFDVTLTITRFRWAPATNNLSDQNRKFRTYAIWVYCGSLIPTSVASFFELSPTVGKNCPFKPNFINFDDTNFAVIGYVTFIPAIVFLANNFLFIYTSWRMFQIQKSTSMATENRAKKSYITYLKLYFLMDAPWLTGALGAIYPDLWILKLFRMVHPILLLMAILPRKMVVNSFKCDGKKMKNNQKEMNNENVNKKQNPSNSIKVKV
ncbi:uncharacterized protein LOC127288607 [Leptopilina boulardi]|uniref:uncharacterized protein LOC127288607 n=1 Tax=Leptopilina boulardi TaxID=63433 RepID=UPI0021F68D59|nr:uncharacterized protein LOC127288607 [Leptopilina boulardi]